MDVVFSVKIFHDIWITDSDSCLMRQTDHKRSHETGASKILFNQLSESYFETSLFNTLKHQLADYVAMAYKWQWKAERSCIPLACVMEISQVQLYNASVNDVRDEEVQSYFGHNSPNEHTGLLHVDVHF